jgi:hypothetical protein
MRRIKDMVRLESDQKYKKKYLSKTKRETKSLLDNWGHGEYAKII